MNILVTGGAGFIGSNFIRHMLRESEQGSIEVQIVNLDLLTYAGNLDNMKDVEDDPRYHFIQGDIGNQELVEYIIRSYRIEGIVHCGAETHVDRSIHSAELFVKTNVGGTLVLLDAAKNGGVKKFVHISTDEVYGSLGPTGSFTEDSPLQPNSPYAASKAGSDLLVRSFYHTYGLSVNITRCSNNYGSYQFPEKLIPLMVTHAMQDKPLPIYGNGLQIRDWLHVDDHAEAIRLVLLYGVSGEIYNIGGRTERNNLEVVQSILTILDKPNGMIRYVEDRLGHDRRYAIDPRKIERELGWKPKKSFEEGLRETVQWYAENTEWWHRIQSGAYRQQLEQQQEPQQAI
jgi:dTDP-glucose 4,6-dehydratase